MSGERSVALLVVALEGLLAAMDPQMRLQIALLGDSFTASFDVANKRLDPILVNKLTHVNSLNELAKGFLT